MLYLPAYVFGFEMEVGATAWVLHGLHYCTLLGPFMSGEVASVSQVNSPESSSLEPEGGDAGEGIGEFLCELTH